MELKLVNRLLMLGVAFVGIGDILLSTDRDAFQIQNQVIMDMSDISKLEEAVEDRKRRNEKELMFGDYKFILK